MENQLCDNCNQTIPSASFELHQVHCFRNITKCHCGQAVRKNEIEQHNLEFHTPKPCPKCNQEFLQAELESHNCPNADKQCEFCEGIFPGMQLPQHAVACGNKTTPCSQCKQHVKLRDRQRHVCEEQRQCQYCEATFPQSLFQKHVYDCGNRTDMCPKCGKYVKIRDLDGHLCQVPQQRPQRPEPQRKKAPAKIGNKQGKRPLQQEVVPMDIDYDMEEAKRLQQELDRQYLQEALNEDIPDFNAQSVPEFGGQEQQEFQHYEYQEVSSGPQGQYHYRYEQGAQGQVEEFEEQIPSIPPQDDEQYMQAIRESQQEQNLSEDELIAKAIQESLEQNYEPTDEERELNEAIMKSLQNN